MQINLSPDFEVSDKACKDATGKSLAEWHAELDAKPELATKRREALNWMTGEKKDYWWPTTVWVEYERAKNRVQKDGKLEGYNICVTKTIAAPVAKVFAAFSGSQLADWFGDAPDCKPDGSFQDSNGHKADALRVRENKDLRFKWQTCGVPDETQLDIAFSDTGKGKTGVLLNHMRIQSRDEADGLRKAWGEAFDRLKAKLEG